MSTENKNIPYSNFSLDISDKIDSIIVEAKKNVFVEIKDVSTLDRWVFNKETLNISHVTGNFFSITGIYQIDNKNQIVNQQAVINQPEIGLLGLIVRNVEGDYECLVQAKMEPGNINLVQLSPTLQATYSNYTSVHKGKKPMFLDLFLDYNNHKLISNTLQPEQTHKFYKKYNRNIVVQVDSEFEIPNSFIWIKFDELKKLQLIDNLVNMDLRSIISSIHFLNNKKSFELFSLSEIESWINKCILLHDYHVKLVDLKNIKSCVYNDGIIKDVENSFEIIGVHIKSESREVSEWSQPLVRVLNNGKYGFIIAKIEGVVHFLVRFQPHIGSKNNLELTTSFDDLDMYSMEIYNQVLQIESSKIHFECFQSEEGGRFYQYVNQNILIEIQDYRIIDLVSKFKWLTFDQINHFIKKGYFSMEARSIFSIYNN